MKKIENFGNIKEKILQEYENIKKENFLPLKVDGVEISKETIETDMENFRNERFVVSICGQVKVGKSTALNAMIFGRDILPNAGSPETAKLTEISWGDTPSFTAEFYTTDEWNNLKKEEVDGKNYYTDYLQPMLDEYRSMHGMVYPEEMLQERQHTNTDMSKLREYVGASGKYTPFIKMCSIKYPAEILREVIIVDTPGTNDPNPIRSRETERWIGRSDAVVFMMYAGQALALQDKEFIEQYLLAVPSDKIMLVLSKIDTISNHQAIKNYVEETLKGVEGFKETVKKLKPYGIAPICYLYPRLRKLHNAGQEVLGEELLEDISYHLDDRKSALAELIAADGYMPEFINGVEEYLLKNKAEGLINSHIQKIISVYIQCQRECALRIHGIDVKIALRQESVQELEATERNLKAGSEKIRGVLREWTESIIKLRNDIEHSTGEEVKRVLDSTINEMDGYIQAKPIQYLMDNLAWEAKASLENGLVRLRGKLKTDFKKHEQEIDDIIAKVSGEVHDMRIFEQEYIDEIFKLPDVWSIVASVEAEIINKFAYDKMKELRRRKWLGLAVDDDASRSGFLAKIKETFTYSSGVRDQIKNAISGHLDGISNVAENVKSKIQTAIEEKNEEIMKIKNNRTDNEEQCKKLQIEKEGIAQEEEKYKQKELKIKNALSGM